ncbi:substrate-binding domain-containing protein [Nitrospira sp. BLG_1]|uniref:substrate-binding domain-containing protein n=1 Tax=Nitrospira sp. BLG_1 TaxID=3395883 RepID=UPI0039BD27C9
MTFHEQPQETASAFSNRLKAIRAQRGLSQGDLAARAGITRQAISAIESNLYLPTTAVALKLASVLACHVEDLFSLVPTEDIIEGTLVGHLPSTETNSHPIRVKVSSVGKRTIVRPVTDLGEQLSFAVPADGYVTDTQGKLSGSTVRVTPSRDRDAIEQEISVAGCDPAIFLVGEHLRRHKDRTTVVGWTMGSMAALQSLQRGEVHVAGMHLFDPVTSESNLPFLKRSLKGSGYEVVTFAIWEEGFLVRRGNPLSIRTTADLAEPIVTLVNREEGSGARLLLDQRLRTSGIEPQQVRGYDRIVSSHVEVARAIAGRQAEVGIGIRSAAQQFNLDFVPLQTARYDLVVPKSYLKSHPTLTHLFETLASRPFRKEIEALGGYDTSETGKVRTWHA